MEDDLEPGLEPLFGDGTITRAVARLTSGKEATVWTCEAGPALDGCDCVHGLVAVKVYRTAHARSFGGHHTYLDTERIVDGRARRAVQKSTRTGREMLFALWVEREWEALRHLWADGLSVPRPFRHVGSSIAMEYIGDGLGPAPLLHEVRLDLATTRETLASLLDEVRAMLGSNRVHGDLSPYNVLWWDGRARIIDLPQAVDPRFQPEARLLLERDVTRLTDWAARRGVEVDPLQHCARLWSEWERGDPS